MLSWIESTYPHIPDECKRYGKKSQNRMKMVFCNLQAVKVKFKSDERRVVWLCKTEHYVMDDSFKLCDQRVTDRKSVKNQPFTVTVALELTLPASL